MELRTSLSTLLIAVEAEPNLEVDISALRLVFRRDGALAWDLGRF